MDNKSKLESLSYNHHSIEGPLMSKSLLISVFFTLMSTYSFAEVSKQKNNPDSKSLQEDATSEMITPPNKEIQAASKAIFGIDPKNKFSLYQPSYFIFGRNNLKIQFSAKYRVAKTYNLYLGYSQVMFWNIYDKSAPFEDINYNPELFYRILESDRKFIRSIDLGYHHTSNGQEGEKSRSIDRVFLKTNFATNFGRNNILGEFKLQSIFNKDVTNRSIIERMGFWELKLIVTHVLVHDSQRIDVEYRFFSGKKVVDLGNGGREIGLIYRLGSDNFNPAFYLQYYSGYAETLINYDKNVNEVRAGLLLFF